MPFVHFFDGFRTSHELNTIELLSDDDLRALVPEELVRAHRARALSPERPFIRGTAQNPDVYFQARGDGQPVLRPRARGRRRRRWTQLGERTGRRYQLVDYSGAPRGRARDRVMGSGGGDGARDGRLAHARGERVGVVQVRLYRPFPAAGVARGAARRRVRGSPCSTAPRSPARSGEPLFLDVLAALSRGLRTTAGASRCRA